MYESKYAKSFETIRDDMQAARRRLFDGTLSAEQGEAAAKMAHVEVKAAEIDLHDRVFAHKVGRNLKEIEGSASASVGEAAITKKE